MGPVYAYFAARPWEAGLYTLTGNGGTQVGPFSVSTNFPAEFTVTDWDSVAAINRAVPLTLHWTGSGFQRVTILVSSNRVTGSTLRIVNINCENMPTSLGTYTIPPETLSYLLTGAANLTIEAINQATFTAPLVPEGQTDIGMFNADLGIEKLLPVQ